MQKKPDINIFCFYYKPVNTISTCSIYTPVWAGKNKKPDNEGFVGDDTGENISNKNKYYSELTGLYWVWRNTRSDIVGSCHYRRYFTLANEPFFYRLKRLLYFSIGLWKKRFGLIYTQNKNYWEQKIISENEIVDLFENYQAILPQHRKLKYSVEEHYRRYHNIEDLNRIEKILETQYPSYLDTYKLVLKGKQLFANNMFVLKWETFDKLMEWLFSILFRFEDEINLKEFSGYQERIFGFLSERLITIWIVHNNLIYKELPLIYFKKLKPTINA